MASGLGDQGADERLGVVGDRADLRVDQFLDPVGAEGSRRSRAVAVGVEIEARAALGATAAGDVADGGLAAGSR